MLVITTPEQYEEKEKLYYNVRQKEGRIITDEQLKELPYVYAGHPYKQEWDIRAGNFERLLQYLKKESRGRQLNILDIGCGNGWMTHALSKAGYKVTGIDLNMEELLQAERVFGTSGTLQWIYGDVMKDTVPGAPYDVIVMSASCQYFNDIAALTERLATMLADKGTIHLTDSIFYPQKEQANAAKRSETYYANAGFPGMSQYYHHHTIEALKKAGYTKVYPTLFSPRTPLQWWKYVKP